MKGGFYLCFVANERNIKTIVNSDGYRIYLKSWAICVTGVEKGAMYSPCCVCWYDAFVNAKINSYTTPPVDCKLLPLLNATLIVTNGVVASKWNLHICFTIKYFRPIKYFRLFACDARQLFGKSTTSWLVPAFAYTHVPLLSCYSVIWLAQKYQHNDKTFSFISFGWIFCHSEHWERAWAVGMWRVTAEDNRWDFLRIRWWFILTCILSCWYVLFSFLCPHYIDITTLCVTVLRCGNSNILSVNSLQITILVFVQKNSWFSFTQRKTITNHICKCR